MKLSLNEVRDIIRSMLQESKCTKCGYDNPYMDDDPNYVCRQCKVRMEKLGGKEPSPLDGVSIDFDKEEDDDQWEEDNDECPECGNRYEDGHEDGCDYSDTVRENYETLDRDEVIERFGQQVVDQWEKLNPGLGYSDELFRYNHNDGKLSVHLGDQPGVDEVYTWDEVFKRWT